METVVVMPKLGLTMVEGTVVGWRKSPGDPVAKGDILVEVMTDKISMEVEAQAEGFLRKILAPEGSVVPVAEPIAVIGDSAGSQSSEEDFVRATPAAKRCARGHGVEVLA
ncbi:MAG: 2-oxo acid dehydrogenase subunit E2, partial [Actinobacteria bacterium]|nr:2-oxo acid dehydrogenase subunit E2 [Actinomycetota bacterium]